MADERGQASLELVAGVPLLIGVALVCLQLLATGYTLSVADGAVEAGAIALAAGEDAAEAVRETLPEWASRASEVEVRGGRITVSLRPPSALESVSAALEVRSSAWVRPPAS